MLKNYYLVFIFLLTSIKTNAQEARVGINTDSPKATLDIRELPISSLPEGYPQGVIFPSFTTKERKTFKNVKKGTMLYNTTRECLEIYTVKENKEGWYCLGAIEEALDTQEVTAQEVTAKQSLMFQDDESPETLFSGDKRGFYLKEMLQVRKIEGNKIRIRNFLPHTFRNVQVYYKTPNIEKAVAIINIAEIAPLAEFEQELSFNKDILYFEDEEGNRVEVDKTEIENNNNTITLKVENDVLFNKMSSIKHQTFVRFHNYASGNWGVTTAKHAREYLPILANFAYLYSSDKFKEAFINFPYDLYDNGKKPLNRPVVYEKFFSVSNQNIGVTAKVEGLGGGAAFGIHSRFLNNNAYYQPNNAWSREAWSHEYGHVIGYSHSSNMTYKGPSGHGYVEIVINLYKEMFENGELPFVTNPYK